MSFDFDSPMKLLGIDRRIDLANPQCNVSWFANFSFFFDLSKVVVHVFFEWNWFRLFQNIVNYARDCMVVLLVVNFDLLSYDTCVYLDIIMCVSNNIFFYNNYFLCINNIIIESDVEIFIWGLHGCNTQVWKWRKWLIPSQKVMLVKIPFFHIIPIVRLVSHFF